MYKVNNQGYRGFYSKKALGIEIQTMSYRLDLRGTVSYHHLHPRIGEGYTEIPWDGGWFLGV